MPSKLKKAIGTVKDQTSIGLAKVANSGSARGGASALEVAILKATTHDEVAMDDRHVSETLNLISSNKAYAAVCAAAIGKRISRTRDWIVALKSLILVLRIFQDGDPYFPREVLHAMKRGAKILNLSSFRDDSNSSPWDFTAFVRTFALYLDERLDCFLTGKLQRRFTNRDRDHPTGGTNSRLGSHTGGRSYELAVRDMKPVMLLDKITYWQRLLDRAIATRPTGVAKSNKLVRTSLYAVVQESFDLYKDISDGLALLLDSFFHLQYQSCVQVFQACVRASKQFEELNGFYDFCKSNSVGRTSEYPSVQKISEELLETLQEFLKDQSSFPATNGRSPSASPSPSQLIPPPSSKDSTASSSQDCGESPDMSDRYSDYGSYCSISVEDLVSMSESRASPPMSCYSEPHGKHDDPGNNFDTISNKSLPNDPTSSNLMDLVLFEDVNGIDRDVRENQENSGKGSKNVDRNDPWELMILGDDRRKNAGEISAEPSKDDPGNWLLVLEETATQVPARENGDIAAAIKSDGCENSIVDALLDPTAVVQASPKLYNPFLEESSLDHLAISPPSQATATVPPAVEVSSAAAFQVEPTFRANIPQDFEPSSTPTFRATPEASRSPTAFSFGCDPFEASDGFGFEEKLLGNGSLDRENFLQEQQSWLQNQNKIMAKHLN